jgi:hypothetical protein
MNLRSQPFRDAPEPITRSALAGVTEQLPSCTDARDSAKLLAAVAGNAAESVAVVLTHIVHDLPSVIGEAVWHALACRAAAYATNGKMWTPLHDALAVTIAGRRVNPERPHWEPLPYEWPSGVATLTEMADALRPWIREDVTRGKESARLLRFRCEYIHFLSVTCLRNPGPVYVKELRRRAPLQMINLARRQLPPDTATYLARWASRTKAIEATTRETAALRRVAKGVWNTMTLMHPDAIERVRSKRARSRK